MRWWGAFFEIYEIFSSYETIQIFSGRKMNIYGRYVQNFRTIRGQVRSEHDIKDTRLNKKKMSQSHSIQRKIFWGTFWRHCQLIWPRIFLKICTHLQNVLLWSYTKFRVISKGSGVIVEKVKGAKNASPPGGLIF